MAAIVCGVDGTAPARAAARLSAALARRLGVELVLHHALPRRGERVDALTTLEELRRELDVPTARLRVDIGPAPERLTTASQGAALVVVGGANGQADRMTFGGSVRTTLARHARCPVAVVPASAPPRRQQRDLRGARLGRRFHRHRRRPLGGCARACRCC